MNAIELLFAAKEKMETGQYNEAIDLATKAHEAGETQVAVSKILSNSYYKANKHAEALNWYKSVLEKEPHEKVSMLHLGICCALCGKPEESITAFNRYIDVYPDQDGYFNRGYSFLAMNKHNEAKQDMLKAIELNCANPLVWFYAGIAHYNLKEYTAAEKYLIISTEHMPEHSEAAYLLGCLYFNTKRMQQCIDAMNKVLYYNETRHEALYYRMIAKKETGDYRGAETDANNLLKINDNYFKLETEGKQLRIVAIEVTDEGEFNFKVE